MPNTFSRGSLRALIFVSSLAGDIALAGELDVKPGNAELAAGVR